MRHSLTGQSFGQLEFAVLKNMNAKRGGSGDGGAINEYQVATASKP